MDDDQEMEKFEMENDFEGCRGRSNGGDVQCPRAVSMWIFSFSDSTLYQFFF